MLRAASAVAVLVMFMPRAEAQLFGKKPSTWNTKYTAAGTLGVELEGDFGKLLGTCGASVLDQKRGDYSAIPEVLQSALKAELSKPVTALSGPSSAVLFRYVFPQQSLNGFDSTDPGKQLPATFFEMSDVPTPVKGLSSKIYAQTCSSILAAALSLKLNPPSASIQGALSDQYKANNSVALVSGTFYSPLYGVLADTGSSADQLAALLALWQYYRSNSAQATKPMYYLSGFNGMAAFFLTGRSRSEEYDVKANASGNWLIASMDAKVSANLKEESKLTVTDYVTIAAKKPDGSDDVAFRQLPSPRDIADEFGRRNAVFKPVAEDYVKQNAPFRHYFELRGIPDEMCKKALWNVSPVVGGIEYQDAHVENGACKFFVNYNAPQDLSAVPPALSYKIRGTQAIGSNELVLDATFRPVTTKHPIPAVSDFQKRPTLITSPSAERSLRWTIPVRFVDAQDPVQLSLRPPDISSANLSCGGATDTIIATVTPDSTNSGVVITVDRKLASGEVVDSSREKECSFGGSLVVALVPSGATPRDAVRAINTSVVMPAIALPVSPSTSPMPVAPPTPLQ
jgi:hypothetical protein